MIVKIAQLAGKLEKSNALNTKKRKDILGTKMKSVVFYHIKMIIVWENS